MKNEILVTGATGFLGRFLVAALESEGHTVRQHSSADGDIAVCSLPMEGVSHVFHLAAKSYVPESWENPRAYYQTNVVGTVNVLEHCRQNHAALTLISTYMYGEPQRLPIGENHPVAALNPYTHTKILAEEAARFYEKRFDVPLLIVRPFNIYGPGQRPTFLIPWIVQQVLDPAADVVHVQDLRPRRDYLYVDDALALLMAAFRADSRGVFNMGGGRSASVEEIALLVNKAAGLSKPVVSADRTRPGEVMDMVADTSHAAAELGWRPRTSLEDGIAAVVAAERASRG
jgi:nucleoside-diphosphate-sugar epimerase